MPRSKKSPFKLKLKPDTIYSIIAVILITLGLLVVVSFTGQGAVLIWLNDVLQIKLGVSLLFLPFIFISAGMMLFRTKWIWSRPNILLGTLFLFLGTLGFLGELFGQQHTGQIGAQTFSNVARLLSPAGAYITFAALFVIGFLILTQLSIAEAAELLGKLREKFPSLRRKRTDAALLDQSTAQSGGFSLRKLSLGFGKGDAAGSSFSINEGEKLSADAAEEQATALAAAGAAGAGAGAVGAGAQTGGAGDGSGTNRAQAGDELGEALLSNNSAPLIWEYPPLSLLSSSDGGEADRGDVNDNAQKIEETLKSFNIGANIVEVNYGPSVTQYAIEVYKGTKLSKITSLSTDLALALAAPGGQIRIEAPIPGRSLVGIEVPNYSPQYVTLKKMLASSYMKKHPSKLAVALGIDVAGKPAVMDIAKMPHLLIAGATGSGKSVAINTFLCSILFRASPAEVKLILVDPKRVELTGYNDIPHLLVPVIVEPKKVVSALNWATHEMDRRYKQLAEVGVRNIEGYNELAGHAAMPNIVIVIDELADIMLFAPSEVEESITRIAQMARAVGIHLVLATQRPSVDVITGLIKANIPGRIAFNVSSMTDSRVILDSPGAEKLLGKGDMLFQAPDKAKPARVQGTFVSDGEIKSLIDFIKSQGQEPEYEEDIVTKYKAGNTGASTATGDADDRDELFDEVVPFIAKAGKGSSSMIQRHFSVGYNRAARILDQLHAAGMVGPQEGSKPRDVSVGVIAEYLRSRQGGQ